VSVRDDSVAQPPRPASSTNAAAPSSAALAAGRRDPDGVNDAKAVMDMTTTSIGEGADGPTEWPG
jgi:hypothetical protein